MLNSKQIKFLEKNMPFYNKLDNTDKNSFTANAFNTVINKNQLINTSDNQCTGLIVVINGGIRAFLNSSEGKEVTLYKLLEGDCCIFSASCIFNNINFNVSLETIEDTEVIILPTQNVDALSKRNIIFKEYLLQLTQSKMSEVIWIMEQILFTSFDKRLKNYLLDFNSSVINITHNQIANDLGTAREVVSRMLKYFEKEGMIKLNRGSIELLDLSDD